MSTLKSLFKPTLIIFLLLIITSDIFSQSVLLRNKFAFGIVGELLRKRKFQKPFHLDNYNALNLDVQQSYSNRGDNDLPWEQCFGGFKDNINIYSGVVNATINYTDALKVFERAKIVRPAYGQRSTYQAEVVEGTTFPQYYYSERGHETGRDFNDPDYNNIRVRKCIVNEDEANKFIVKNLIENCEQINRPTDAHETKWDIEYMISDNKEPGWVWYVKPKMRIPMSVVNDNSKQDIVVVRIEIVNFNNSSVSNYDIKVSNFKNYPNYNGQYIEIFYDENGLVYDLSILSSILCSGVTTKNNINSQVDYRIYWPGLVDVYLDYVRVDDKWAHFLFNPDLDLLNVEPYNFTQKILDETSIIGLPNDLLSYYYMDECPINSFPCISEVNRIIKQQPGNGNKGLFAIMMQETALQDYGYLKNKPINNEEYINYILSIPDLMTDVFLYTCYPFHNNFKIPSNLSALGMGEGIEYAQAISPADYNNTMMNNFQQNMYQISPKELPNGQVIYSYNMMSKMVKRSRELGRNISPAFFIQAHSFEYWMADNLDWYNLREPTNEEMMLQGNMALIYGAKQVYLFSYSTDVRDSNGKEYYSYGLMNDTGATTLRESNYFGQDKWQGAINVSTNIQKIGDVLYPAGTNNTMHMTYVDSRSVNPITYPTGIGSGLPFLYINELRSLDPNINGQNPCVETGIMTEYYDCPNERYWELGFFDQPSSSTDGVSKYFIALNKRSTPDEGTGIGVDTRILKLRFNPSYFSGYSNWMIKDAVTNVVISKFDINSSLFVNAGTYKPAEAKLLKIVPVTKEGGTLVADETFSGNVNCNGMIYNGGHNITISPNAVVTFSDSAGIEMNGGCFISGVNADNADDVTLTGKTSSTFWKGITLIGCDSIGVYNTNISNIKANDTAKAFSIINSYKVNFRRNTINANSNSGGIQAVYNSFSDNPIVFNVRECTFNMNQSGYSAISVLSNASVTLPIVTEWCLFNSQNDTSNAILFTEVTGGAIKNNLFSNFGKSVVLMYSTTDFYGNTILGKDNSQGILCLSGSYASLSPTSGQYLGGYNYIKNYGTSASNVYSNNSYFNIQNGQNDFDLSDIDNSKHLTGDLSGMPYSYVNATKNCFHKDSITNIDATHTVVWYDNSPVNFIFTDYSCELTPPGDYYVYQYGGYNDTVYYRSGGEGSGFNPNKPMNIEENVYKSLKDTININLRKRNYLIVEDKAKQLLTQYPDSLESATMVQKLYMASLSLDSTKIGITKTFLENLISANTQNPTLIKRAFYFIQKCKVKLGQFQSALDGFQYIMTQNPYTYEGLVASWDYAATYLLMGSGGSYKGELEQTTEELNTPADTLLSRMTKSDINTNKSKNTNTTTNTNSNRNSTEQITKTFYEKIKNVTKDDKTAQEEKVKTLEKKIETTKSKTEKSDAITELATMKQIKEVVKLKKPNTIVTHTTIINNDIKKVFGIGKKNSNESTNSLVPQTYALYQNYPNPFNPTTKLAYDIPKDAKVKLVIYDILGREMKTLVNNEFRSAGKYITEFNGSNLASGIYFARILVNEGKDFMAVKKMVLLK